MNSIKTKKLITAAFTALILSIISSSAQTRLGAGHVDVGIGFEDGAFDLHIHDEGIDEEFEPDTAVLVVRHLARTTIPNDPRFAFLGSAGSPVWALPQIENERLLFLGLSAEEIEKGIFMRDELTMTLKKVHGPGHVFLYSTSGVTGDPDVRMNSRDGVSTNDFAIVLAGGHTDYNWAFTAPGTYSLVFQASGVLVEGNKALVSEEIEYTFDVQAAPELTISLAANNQVAVSWEGLAGETYALHSLSNVTGAWTVEGASIAGANRTHEVKFTPSHPARFFRLTTSTQ